MAFPGQNYAPPNVYTRTTFDNPLQGAIDSLQIPVFIGEGNEFLTQRDLELVRGSSAQIDQRIVGEDMTGRAVVSVSVTGVVTLGDFDGTRNKVQVRNLPVVDGSGRGTTSNSRADVTVTINGLPAVVVQLDGTTGILTLAQSPNLGDVVRVSYFFNREDTLITENLSGQVSALDAQVYALKGILDVNAPTPGTAVLDIYADVLGPSGEVIVPANNVLNLIVDGVESQIVLTPKSNYTMQQIANVISAAGAESLTATTFVNNFGESALLLTADNDLTVLDGSANALLGIQAGQISTRTKTFYTYQGPIVDGSNGGVTTTDPSHVVVKVNGVQVIPVSVDGASRAITLATAPKAGSTVTVTYWFNTWQDTFDYLAHFNVRSVSLVGDVPGGSQYTQGADFILQDDKILWGTAATVVSDVATAGSELFDDTQVTLTLVDERTYMTPASPVVTSAGAQSSTEFLLAFAPTLGNGRSTGLGQSLFQSVSNNRIGLPVNRPDVISAYWGFSVEDALFRGRVEVVKVEGSIITLKDPVPVGASVYTSHYYNTITDEEYTLQVGISGPSGTGTYTIQNSGGETIYTPKFRTASKSAGLTGVTIEFPSGSELTPGMRFEGGSGAEFAGPLEETVLVTFANTQDTPAKYTVAGPAPYAFIQGESDLVAMTINGDTVLPAAGTDLDTISIGGGGIMAHLVGAEIQYPDGVDFDAINFAGGDEQVILTLDNDTEVTALVEEGANKTVADWVASINLAADGAAFLSQAAALNTEVVLAAALPNRTVSDHFVGWRVVIGDHALGGAAPGEVRTVVSDDGAGTLTVDAAFSGVMANNTPCYIYNPDTVAKLKGATRFNGPVDLTGGFNDLSVAFNVAGSAGPQTVTGSLPAASYASAAALATALNTAFRGASGDDITTPAAVGSPIALAIVADGTLDGLDFVFEADGDGRITLVPQVSGLSAGAYFTFIAQGLVTDDFGLLAGFDVGATHDADQAKLVVSEVAKAYQITLGGTNPHDRLILRNRIHPGGVSVSAHDVVAQCKLVIGAGSGNEKAGIANGDYGEAAAGATVQAASILGRVGFGGGSDALTGEPTVTFFDGTGAQPQNNVFIFTLDGVPVQVEFTASSSGTTLHLGVATVAGSIIEEIQTALANLTGQPFGNLVAIQAAGIISAEGAGIRITSQGFRDEHQVIIGGGSANAVLGFQEGAVAARQLVTAEVLASALNSDRETSLADFLHDFDAIGVAANEFAAQAVALVFQDSVGRKYLHIASAGPASSDYGTGSTIELLDATSRSWLFVGSGVDELDGNGSDGDAATNGFFVTSDKPTAGSGSSDTSVLNAGSGQDGKIGQTYRDDVTGLTFTILPRGWHDNQAGPWIAYPSGASFSIEVRSTVTTDANLPVKSIPGVEMVVANTSGISSGDSALVTTYPRGGEEPAIGDIYYASYVYQKQDFTTAFFTRMSAIEAAYGAINPDNPVSLASYLAILNGAVLVGIKQVPREEGAQRASLATYLGAINELEGVLVGQIKPDIITPLRGDSTQLFQLLSRSNDIQSSIRYQSERTSIIGMEAGSTEAAAKALAGQLQNDRMRLVYPDMALIDIEEQTTDGRLLTKEHLISGPYLAAMMAGSVVSPNRDVATPWTRRRLFGPNRLARTLDPVQQNQLAQAGITVLEDRPPYIRVRHGLTTDMTSIVTKTPTIRQIADFVQQQSRRTLDQFIGQKFLPGILSQIEGRLAKLLQTLVSRQIIALYTGVRAVVDPEDPTVANVEAFYQPIFPLLYIVLEYHLRANNL